MQTLHRTGMRTAIKFTVMIVSWMSERLQESKNIDPKTRKVFHWPIHKKWQQCQETNHVRLGCKHKVFKTLQRHPLDWQLCLVILAAVILSLKQLVRKTKVSNLYLVLVINPAQHIKYITSSSVVTWGTKNTVEVCETKLSQCECSSNLLHLLYYSW